MKKFLTVAVLVGLVIAIVTLKQRNSQEFRAEMARRMRHRMESMPEDFPPRVMFDNLAATRANTERILDLLGET